MATDFSFQRQQLRQKAENRFVNPLSSYITLTDHAIYELEIHQTELELQQEELEKVNEELHSLYQEYWELYEFAPCGYVTLNSSGLIIRINQAGVKLLGLGQSNLTYLGFSKFIIPQHQQFFYESLHAALQTREQESLEVKSAYTNLWIHLDLKANFNGKGQAKQWLLAITDVTADKEADQAREKIACLNLLEEQTKRQTLVNSITHYIHQSFDVEEIVEKTIAQVIKAFPVTRVLIALCDHNQETFDWVRVGTVNESGHIITATTLCCDYSQVQEQLQIHPLVAINDVATTEITHPLLAEATEARSLLATGIWYHNMLQGIISLEVSSEPYHWQESEQQLLQQISDQLAIALQQAQVYEALKLQLSEDTD